VLGYRARMAATSAAPVANPREPPMKSKLCHRDHDGNPSSVRARRSARRAATLVAVFLELST